MSGRTTSAYDVELTGTLIDGTTLNLGLMLDPETGPDGRPVSGTPRVTQSSLSAQSSEAPLSDDLDVRIYKNTGHGLGYDYDGAYGVDSRRPGFYFPAGAATNVSITGFANATTGPIVDFAEFEGNLYIAQQGYNDPGTPGNSTAGRVLVITGGTGTASASLTAPAAAGGTLGNADFIQGLVVADDGSGNQRLYATSWDYRRVNARMYLFDGSSWSTATARGVAFSASRGLGRMAYVGWIDPTTGLTTYRIVVLTGYRTFAYLSSGANPISGTASFSSDIKVGTAGTLHEIAAFRRHAFLSATDNLYDVNELGESNAQTDFLPKLYGANGPDASTSIPNGIAVAAQHGYLYYGGKFGLVRTYVGDNGVLDESPLEGMCSPGYGTRAEGAFRGPVTALLPDGGGIWCAVYEPTQKRSYIFWGIDRRIVNKEVDQPLVWHGPLVVIDTDYKVTRMHMSTLTGSPRLWIGSQNVAASTARLDWVSEPLAGSGIQDITAGGAHRFCTQAASPGVVQGYSILEGLLDDWDDASVRKILYQWSAKARGPLTTTTPRLRLDTRADPDPGTATPPAGSGTYPTGNFIPADGATWTPSTDVTPETVSGYQTQWRVAFFTPSGGQTPPVLESLRALAWKRAPSLDTLSLTVRYGEGVPNTNGGEQDSLSPDQISALLKTATESGRLTIRLPNDERKTVALRQVKVTRTEYFGGRRWGKRVTARIEASVLGDA